MDEKRFALLIDSDNISANYIGNILDELSQYGIVSYKRIYGDWNSTNNKNWRGVLSDYALQPMQQFANVKGKNATDSLMIIDCMDILYSDTVDGFCLVTSDSDFTRLAARLRESGKTVIGMGESKTSQSFVAACDAFVNLENFKTDTSAKKPVSEEKEPSAASKRSTVTTKVVKEEESEFKIQSKKEIEKWIQSVLVNLDGKRLDMNELVNRLRRRYSDFDYRNYEYKGHKCSNMTLFLESLDSILLLRGRNNQMEITCSTIGKVNLKKTIVEILTKTPEMEISAFGKKIKEKVPGFNVKDYNCAQLKKFLARLTFLTVSNSEDQKQLLVSLNK